MWSQLHIVQCSVYRCCCISVKCTPVGWMSLSNPHPPLLCHPPHSLLHWWATSVHGHCYRWPWSVTAEAVGTGSGSDWRIKQTDMLVVCCNWKQVSLATAVGWREWHAICILLNLITSDSALNGEISGVIYTEHCCFIAWRGRYAGMVTNKVNCVIENQFQGNWHKKRVWRDTEGQGKGVRLYLYNKQYPNTQFLFC